jgi:hypothetical protein
VRNEDKHAGILVAEWYVTTTTPTFAMRRIVRADPPKTGFEK